MTRHHDLAAEALSRGAEPGRGYTVARLISQILHPVLLTLLSILIVGTSGIGEQPSGALWATLTIFLQVIPPTIFFVTRLRQGIYSDEDISIRQQRNELYLFGTISVVAGTAILYLLKAPLPLLALLISGLLLNLTNWLINFFWKISIHSGAIGSCATIGLIYVRPLGIVLCLLAVALGWARVRTRNHTPTQVVAGFSLAVICILFVFWIFGLIPRPEF